MEVFRYGWGICGFVLVLDGSGESVKRVDICSVPRFVHETRWAACAMFGLRAV